MVQPAVTFISSDQSPRLTEQEVEELFPFLFHVHNHDASTPPQPIFWVRTTESDDIRRFWN